MSNVVNFPDRTRVEVSMAANMETGNTVFIFDLVEGGSRNIIATHETASECAKLAGELMADGTDVIWDEPTRRRLFIDSAGTT